MSITHLDTVPQNSALLETTTVGHDLAARPGRPEAGLANVAATLLELLGLPVPDGYEPSLLA